ncbi:gephyrin-like molybdotransferase Glp [Halomonas halocynthiae]|uniref:molybdopterin molybdotransferase MoeA n=1 Tax=Halomonas halocynthiae TaxID=176290 RepID=UPI0003F9E719|nr:gephyrin-like molybdotransferase Glp [Halomonas halocynthiae]
MSRNLNCVESPSNVNAHCCLAETDGLLSPQEARERLLSLITGPLEAESVALEALHGRVLSAPVISPMAVPRHTNSAMDGIALAWPEAGTGNIDEGWLCVGRQLAGMPLPHAIGHGECIKITTGAPLPSGVDTVIMQERLQWQGDRVYVQQPQSVRQGQNVRQAGEDITVGSKVLNAGTRLNAAQLGILASLGLTRCDVHRRPQVAVFSTGNEVTAPGQPLGESGIYDANRYALMALVREHGGDVLDLGILPDRQQDIRDALCQAAEQADLVLTSGGVSEGDADMTQRALRAEGQMAFWQLAMKPGKPMACGYLGSRRAVFLGLPGNPVAAMVTFLQFAAPLLARLEGQLAHQGLPVCRTAVSDQVINSRLGRTDFLRGCHYSDTAGQLWVREAGPQGSGILSSMALADCLIEVGPQQDRIDIGTPVTIQLLKRYS